MRTKTNYRKRTMKPFITLSAIVLTVSSLMVTAQQESFNDESNQSDFVEDHSGHAHGSTNQITTNQITTNQITMNQITMNQVIVNQVIVNQVIVTKLVLSS